MESEAATLLLVEDHPPTRQFLAGNLGADGFAVIHAGCAEDAERLIKRSFPDLVILDLGLSDRDGLELPRRVRRAKRVADRIDPDLPMLVLTARASELDRLRGSDRGCDDYVTKPFSYQELRARWSRCCVAAACVPARAGAGSVRWRSIRWRHLVWLHGEELSLSSKESGLLRALSDDAARVFTRGSGFEPYRGSAPSARRGRSTHTPFACGTS